MDISGIVGMVIGLGMVFFGMVFTTSGGLNIGNAMQFVDPQSIAITIGGTIGATLCCHDFSDFAKIPKHLKVMNFNSPFKPKDYIEKLVTFATDARKSGILALEDKLSEEPDVFLKKSVMLIVDAMEPEKTQLILENELDNIETRHAKGFKLYEKASSLAPAFGMIGTLIGLVNMLATLDLSSADGASNLTSGMATALLTTFYGSLFANMFLTPIGSKLRYRNDQEMLCKSIVVEGVLSIQAGDNPKHIEERLRSFLEAGTKFNDGGAGSDE